MCTLRTQGIKTDCRHNEQNMEPDKCETWVWLSFNEIKQKAPECLFLPIRNLLQQTPEFEQLLRMKT